MITSTSNAKIKELVQLQKKSRARNQAGVFIVEGLRMIQEAPSERIEKFYVSESFYKKHQSWLEKSDKGPELVTDTVFARISDTKTPQGILAVIRQMEYSAEAILAAKPPHLLVLDNLQDPGNLGTIFRTAEAAGVTGILMSQDCVDIYNPKTIRSTMGAIYRMPFVVVDSLSEHLKAMKNQGIKVYAAHLAGASSYDQENFQTGVTFLIGNEGNGLRQELTDYADAWIKIPMSGQAESLNAAIATAILMFEVSRQRRQDILE